MVTDYLGTWASQPAAWFVGFGNGAFYALGLGDVYVHNTYIEALAELGIVGFSLLLLLTWFGLRGAWRLLSSWRESPRDRNLAAVLMALLAYQILLSFKQGSFMGEKHLLMLFVVATRLSMLDQPAGESELEHEVGEAAGETGHDHDAVMGRT
jgi:O-antigen ligase